MHCPPHTRQLQSLIGVYVGLPFEDKSRVVEHDAARQLKTKARMDRRSGRKQSYVLIAEEAILDLPVRSTAVVPLVV